VRALVLGFSADLAHYAPILADLDSVSRQFPVLLRSDIKSLRGRPSGLPTAMQATVTFPECPICGASQSVEVRQERFEASYNKIPVVLDSVELFRCASCGEEFFSKEQQREVSKRVKEAARQQLGALQPERIVAIRKKLGLSQEELEELLDLGPKVVTRWENGRVVPGRATTYLLRLMEKMPQIVEELRKLKSEYEPAH
jgi:HTH-type transcriptional regulator / antitoxin MqsA